MTVTLTTLEVLQGALTLVAVLISIVLAILIMLKYLKFKDRNLIFVGLTWLFLYSPYWGDCISFVMIITLGIQLDWSIYFIIGNIFVPIAVVTWIMAFSNWLIKEKQMQLIITTIIIIVIYEIFLISMMIIDIDSIGTPKAPFIVEYAWYIDAFLIIAMIYYATTFVLFIMKSLKSTNPEAVLKGKFLLMALIFFAIGAMMDVAFEITGLTITIARVFLIIASFSFYVGFIMPEFIKKKLIK